jgi:tungstate transport system substrate-binding protein
LTEGRQCPPAEGGTAHLGQAFIDWLVSSEGQRAIADYKINGQQLFFPNADDPNA